MPKHNPFDLLPGLRNSMFFPIEAELKIIEQRFIKLDAAFGVTLRETLVLIAAYERQTAQGHLASVLGINKNMMVKTINRLERKGLVERVRNPKNKRGYLIVDTPKGKKIVVYFRKNRERILQEVFHPLSLEQANQRLQWACEIIEAHSKKRD